MNLTLVVMAAGKSSRFGSPKQTTPIDNDGNFIIDYSIYDAIKAGFTKVVFVIQRMSLTTFQETIGKRLEGKIEVCYAFQSLKDIPSSSSFTKREKPWGTVHAILSAKPYVHEPFVVINADDFYGRNAFLEAAQFLKSVKAPFTYANISYRYGVTKSLNGSVKRGILKLDGNKITSIQECQIETVNGENIATPLLGGDSFVISDEAPVSMNFFAFQEDVFALLEEYFKNFFLQEEDVILEGEVLLPECLQENVENKKITIINRPGNSLWLGMTYKEDLHAVKTNIQFLKETEAIYNNHLWEDTCGKNGD